jgi:peptidoglycan-synthase activator LpoB
MKRSIHALAALALTATFVGCSGPTHSDEDPEARGVIDADSINWHEIRPAVDDFMAKLSRLNAQGWASHVVMTPEPPHKPQVRIHNIQNRTRVRFDTQILKNKLSNALVEQGVVFLVSDAHDHQAVSGERDYSQSGGTTQNLEGDEDATGLVIQGEIQDATIDQGDVRQHDFQFNLRLIDTRKNRVLAVSDTEFRKKVTR